MARHEQETHPPTLMPSVGIGHRDHRIVVSLHGEHDVSTTAMVNEALGRASRIVGADVAVDLSAVEFMGAETLGIVLRFHRILRAQGRDLVVSSPSPAARRMLDLCRLDAPIEAASPRSATIPGHPVPTRLVIEGVRGQRQDATPLREHHGLTLESG
jgi:anti-anti-sigma factor